MTVCPNLDQHTPHPTGYLAYGEWADRALLTHDQHRCDACGLWAIWKPKPGVVAELPPLFEHACVAIRLHI